MFQSFSLDFMLEIHGGFCLQAVAAAQNKYLTGKEDKDSLAKLVLQWNKSLN